jgi:hypothetical protein
MSLRAAIYARVSNFDQEPEFGLECVEEYGGTLHHDGPSPLRCVGGSHLGQAARVVGCCSKKKELP